MKGRREEEAKLERREEKLTLNVEREKERAPTYEELNEGRERPNSVYKSV